MSGQAEQTDYSLAILLASEWRACRLVEGASISVFGAGSFVVVSIATTRPHYRAIALAEHPLRTSGAAIATVITTSLLLTFPANVAPAAAGC